MPIRDLTITAVASAIALTPILGWSQHGNAAAAASAAGAANAAFGTMHGAPVWAGTGAGRNDAPGLGSAQAPGLSRAAEQRRTHAGQLLRTHPELLDRDPAGNLVIRAEILGVAVTPLARAAMQGASFVIERQESIGGGSMAMVVVRAPAGYSTDRALRLLRQIDPDGAYDFNHVYFESGASESQRVTNAAPQARQSAERGTVAFARVGLIDAGVSAAHSALRSVHTVTHGCNGSVLPSSHGTASASRLIDGLRVGGHLPTRVDVYVADVYCGAPVGGSAAAITDAIAWLVDQQVPVINVSLVGPANVVLQRAIELAISRGHLVVSAVGNDGPAAPPLYPAAYPGVVAVTAVDHDEKVLPEAGRGRFVAFAAPGADIEAAQLPQGFSSVRGTSFAAPIVAGQLALLVDRLDKSAADQAVRVLAASATDLGAPGRDPIYGNGCVGCGPLQVSSSPAQKP
jgi:hypothetical protein